MSALRAAALQGNESEVRRLLGIGAAPDEPDESGFTALMLAAKYGHAAILRLLLQRGANVSQRNNFGGTPLKYAALKQQAPTVRLLLAAGADPNETYTHSYTPLLCSLSRFSQSEDRHLVLRLLLEAKADPDWLHEFGGTALNEAAMIRDVASVRELLRGGANPQTALNSPNPVYRMGIRRNPEILSLLEAAAQTHEGKRKGTINEEQTL